MRKAGRWTGCYSRVITQYELDLNYITYLLFCKALFDFLNLFPD